MRSDDERVAQEVLALQNEINYLVADVQQYQARRMAQRERADLETMRLEMDLLSKIRQMYTLAKRLARNALPRTIA